MRRILIGGSGSGCGKTTVTCALLGALKLMGYVPSAFKCGPDYIDPMFHREITGIRACNLDSFFCTPDVIRSLLEEYSRGSDIAVIEGAMGYYDGSSSGASGDMTARITGTPAVLVMDVKGMDESAGAVIKGFLEYRKGNRISGVIFNRLSPSRADRMEGLCRELGTRYLGFLPVAGFELGSRNLGLIAAAEVEGLKERLGELGALALENLKMESILELAESAGKPGGGAAEPGGGFVPGVEEPGEGAGGSGGRSPGPGARPGSGGFAPGMEKPGEDDGGPCGGIPGPGVMPGSGSAPGMEEPGDGAGGSGGRSPGPGARPGSGRRRPEDIRCIGIAEGVCEHGKLCQPKGSGGPSTAAECRTERAADSDYLHEQDEDGPVIAVARDRAFCFIYQENLDLIKKLGCRTEFFSPLVDDALPEGCSGLIICGGYPELYAGQLAGNKLMLKAVHDAVLGGMPCIAECGGFMYLHRYMRLEDGRRLELAGVTDGEAYYAGKLRRFGYATITAGRDGMLCGKGGAMKVHEFHYWDSTACGTDFEAVKPDGRGWMCGYNTESLYAGFPHLYFYSDPGIAERFVLSCRRYRDSSRAGTDPPDQ